MIDTESLNRLIASNAEAIAVFIRYHRKIRKYQRELYFFLLSAEKDQGLDLRTLPFDDYATLLCQPCRHACQF